MINNFHVFPDNSKFFNDNSLIYEKFWDEFHTYKHVQTLNIKELFDSYIYPYIKYTPDLDILEVGCGIGDYTPFYLEYFNRVVGCDLSQIAINIAKEKFPNILFRKNSLLSIPFSDAEFDCVFAIKTISAISDIYFLNKLLDEIYRIIRSSGYLIMIDFCYNDFCNDQYSQITIENIEYHFIQPAWSESPFIHLKKDSLIEVLHKYKLLNCCDILIKSVKGNNEKGMIYVFQK